MSKEKQKKKKAKKRAVPGAGSRTAKTPGDIYFDTAGVFFVVLDREGRVERINKTGCRIMGLSLIHISEPTRPY